MKISNIPLYRFIGYTDAWELRKLGEVSSHRGGTAIENYFSEDGKYKVISIGSYGLDNQYVDQNIRAVENEITRSRVVNKNELTMVLNDKTANGNIIGRCLLIETYDEFVINQRTEIISFNNGVNPKFAYVVLNGVFREQVKKIVQGGTQIYVNYSSVEQLSFSLPSLPEQKAIGTFFSTLDCQITLHQRKLDTLKEQKKTYLKLLFPAKGQTKPAYRFQGYTDAWELRKLGDEVYFYNGRAYKQSELLDFGKYKVVRVGNFNTNEKWYYSNLELEDSKTIDTGDLIYLWATSFGPEIWKGSKSIYHYHIWKLIIQQVEKIDKNYLYMWLYQDKKKIAQNTNGSTMVHITKKMIESRDFMFPTLPEQSAIGTFFQILDQEISQVEDKLASLKEMKKTLLRKLFVS